MSSCCLGWCRGGPWGGGERAHHGRGGVHLLLVGRHGLGLWRLGGVIHDREACSPTDGESLGGVVVAVLVLVHSEVTVGAVV